MEVLFKTGYIIQEAVKKTDIGSLWLKAVFYLRIRISLLAFYHECRSLIGYATHYLFRDR